MTTQQFYHRIDLRLSSYGHYRVTIQYRNKQYSCTTTNSMAVDRLNSDERMTFYPTEKSALIALWNECKRANNLK
jgi:hypothetical protein